MKNLKEAKELLEKYKSITLEQLEAMYSKGDKGHKILFKITGFGTTNSCMLCLSVNEICDDCIYSFRIYNENDVPCLDKIYEEMSEATSAEELFNALQKRISYLTHIIEWYETLDLQR